MNFPAQRVLGFSQAADAMKYRYELLAEHTIQATFTFADDNEHVEQLTIFDSEQR